MNLNWKVVTNIILVLHTQFILPYRYDYDIAILKLAKRINLDDGRVSTICLPKLNETLDLKSSKMIVSGWGRHKEKAPMGSRILQKLEVPFIDWDICKRNSLPTRRHICAGYGEGGKDSCRVNYNAIHL